MLLKLKKEYTGSLYTLNEDTIKYLNGIPYHMEHYYYLHDQNKQYIALKLSKRKKFNVLLNGFSVHKRNFIKVLLENKVLLIDEMFFEKV